MTLHPVPKPRKKAKKARTPLQRSRTPIARGSWLKRSTTPIRKLNPAAKARRDRAFKARLGRADWKALRLACFKRDGFRCTAMVEVQINPHDWHDGFAQFRCENSGAKNGVGLVCDHLTYARFGHENLDDLRTLCRSCNAKETVSKRANWQSHAATR